jgi:hypothetical protein
MSATRHETPLWGDPDTANQRTTEATRASPDDYTTQNSKAQTNGIQAHGLRQ